MRFRLFLLLWMYFFSIIAAQQCSISPCFALLIGIDIYPNMPQENLQGCKNDVFLIKNILMSRFSVPESNIHILTDEKATRSGILESWDILLKKVQTHGPGARVLLFFSGHGSQKKDEEGDEEDGKDETIVPSDSTFDEGKADILDDEIEKYLEQLQKAKAYTTVIWDCCHSGTGVRGGIKTRGIDRKIEVQPKDIVIRAKPALPGVVFISACQSYEKEPEYYAFESKKNYGMLTYHLARAIQKSKPGATYRSVFQEMQTLYSKLPQAPTPSLEGESTRLFLDTQMKDLPRVMKVTDVDTEENIVTLNQGFLQGVTKGSLFFLIKNADNIPKTGTISESHALVVIEEVQALQSIGREPSEQELQNYKDLIQSRFLENLAGLEKVASNWDAVEILFHYGDLQLKFYIEKERVKIEKGQALLERSPMKQEELPDHFQKLLYALEEEKLLKNVHNFQEANVILRVGNSTAVVVWAESDSIISPNLIQDPSQYEPKGFGPILLQGEKTQEAMKLKNIFVQFNKIRNLLTLEMQEEELNAQVNLVGIRQKGGRYLIQGDLPQTKDMEIEITHNQTMGITFTNRSEKRLYPTVLYLGNDLEINIAYPFAGETEYFVAPNKTKLLACWKIDTSQFTGRESLKLIVTTKPVDLNGVQLPSLPQSKGDSKAKTRGSIENIIWQMAFSAERGQYAGQIVRGSACRMPELPQWSVITTGWKAVKKEK
ncbi:MAG: caspase family protein [Candidatus Brocadiae bacterium]|nr:caspase family protein [Candidatus Brocadiia bacterium]